MLEEGVIKAGDFNNFEISKASQAALIRNEIKYLFPIQVATFNPAFEGKDIIGRDRTGSGKTLAYSLPVLERLRKAGKFVNARGQKPMMMVILPTRELAIQVNRVLKSLKHNDREFRSLTVYGGVDIHKQIQTLRGGVEAVIATPGRLWDLIERRELDFSALETIILDETDQMLDIGFQEIIENIIKKIAEEAGKGKVQHLLFSATMPKWVRDIANHFLRKEVEHVDLIEGQEIKTATTVEHLALLCPSYHQFISNISDIV